ncbi:MAG: DUF4214 domain-containing protein [Rhodanobacteraceae bacterium]
MAGLIATRDDVRYAYRLLLGREPDPSGLEHYCELVAGGSVSVMQLSRFFLTSPEFTARFGNPIGPIAKDPPEALPPLICGPCTQRQLQSPNFRYWALRMRVQPDLLHRKSWEWCFVSQALHERDMLRVGRRGMGFAVGQEPLTSLFASMGCEILATDLDVESADQEGWVAGKQHAAGTEQLNRSGLCTPELFSSNVRFRNVDMRNIPDDLGPFDFVWSCCAMEHLGSLRHGMDFVANSLKCLRPGGIAVHTTEYNVDSDTRTLESGHDVIYRRRDFNLLAEELRDHGHIVQPFDFDVGDSEADRYVDEPPYTGEVHLKLRIGGFASTSFGLIVQRGRE